MIQRSIKRSSPSSYFLPEIKSGVGFAPGHCVSSHPSDNAAGSRSWSFQIAKISARETHPPFDPGKE